MATCQHVSDEVNSTTHAVFDTLCGEPTSLTVRGFFVCDNHMENLTMINEWDGKCDICGQVKGEACCDSPNLYNHFEVK